MIKDGRINKSYTKRHYHRQSFISILVLTITVQFTAAFIPFVDFRFHIASAMSTEKSCSKGNDLHSASTLSAENTPNNNDKSSENPISESEGPLLLPESNNDDPSIPKIQLGDTISFEEMGPVIINADGTTRRIDNWDKMTKKEQEVAWRRISKRNAERRAALLEQQQEQEGKK